MDGEARAADGAARDVVSGELGHGPPLGGGAVHRRREGAGTCRRSRRMKLRIEYPDGTLVADTLEAYAREKRPARKRLRTTAAGVESGKAAARPTRTWRHQEAPEGAR